MAQLTPTSVAEIGITDIEANLTAAAGGGDNFKYSARKALVIKNADASPKTITLTAQSTSAPVSGFGTMTKPDFTIVVAAGKTAILPFVEAAFKDATGLVQVTYSAVTSVTVGVVEFPELTAN